LIISGPPCRKQRRSIRALNLSYSLSQLLGCSHVTWARDVTLSLTRGDAEFVFALKRNDWQRDSDNRGWKNGVTTLPKR